MNSYRKPGFATAVLYTVQDYNPAPKFTVYSNPISVHTLESSAALKIQSAYRSHAVRILVRKIATVNNEAIYWQKLIQRQLILVGSTEERGFDLINQETVDSVRSNERERMKMNEALMELLLRLDSVPGLNPNVRELRRHVSRKIVGLQEILDAVSDARIDSWDGFWDDIVSGIEREVCKDQGGSDDMERFCAENLGFQCLQRFLRDQ